MRAHVCVLGMWPIPYGSQEVEMRDVQAQRRGDLSRKQVVAEAGEG